MPTAEMPTPNARILPLNKLPGVADAAKRQREFMAAKRAERAATPTTPKVEPK